MRKESPSVFAGIKGGSVAARAVKAGADLVLNHVDRGARATLVDQRYEFDAEKRVALEARDRRLAHILEPSSVRLLAFARE